MSTSQELEQKFWKALKSDMTMMLGLAGAEHGHTRPMTAQLDPDRDAHDSRGHGPIWFFAANDHALVQALRSDSEAVATFTSKGHDLFACVHGRLSLDNDRATIDRLWNKHIAAWYQGGKDDPKLALLRLDAEHAEIWADASNLIAGIKALFGADPKEDYQDKVAKVALR
ncbi:MAG: pyridoxamine 5'-phosphate oxidase family protein [Rhodospirillales bacterium]